MRALEQQCHDVTVFDDAAVAVSATRGAPVTVELAGSEIAAFVEHLKVHFGRLDAVRDRPEVEVRLVSGAACRTLPDTLAQFGAVLQLPYDASLGWDRFTDCLYDVPAAARQCVVIADGQMLLAGEPGRRAELLEALSDPPNCFGGWRTVVLVDDGKPAGREVLG